MNFVDFNSPYFQSLDLDLYTLHTLYLDSINILEMSHYLWSILDLTVLSFNSIRSDQINLWVGIASKVHPCCYSQSW